MSTPTIEEELELLRVTMAALAQMPAKDRERILRFLCEWHKSQQAGKEAGRG